MTENDIVYDTKLNKKITKLLVLNNEDLKPFIEVFEFSGENIILQPLGKIIGAFEIKDESDYSAFIVNFLTSTVKKEYFINPNRTAEESLEAALNKVNKALSELANQNNVNWMGKLDAAVAVVDERNLYFSVTGQAKILIIRKKQLIDISAGLASVDAGFHPIKTFIDISSGEMQDGDTIIITTDDLFHVFSMEQLAKGAKRFDSEKFIQFINTGLVNELPIAGTIIVNVKACKKTEKLIKTDDYYSDEFEINENINYFSQSTYPEEVKDEPQTSSASFYEEQIEKEPEVEDKPKHYVDKRTGHIYIKDDGDENPEPGVWEGIASKATGRLKKLTTKDKFRTKNNKTETESSEISHSFINKLTTFFKKIPPILRKITNQIKETFIKKK